MKGKKVAQELILNYGFKQAILKDLSLSHLERLNEKEANRYIIYKAILKLLPNSKSLDDLKGKLAKKNTRYYYKRLLHISDTLNK